MIQLLMFNSNKQKGISSLELLAVAIIQHNL
jgi:hypothetical protein